jgi:hypothetical protein
VILKAEDQFSDEYLAAVDQNIRPFDLTSKYRALGLTELVPAYSGPRNALSSRWAFDFHEKYGRAVADAYFKGDDAKFFNKDESTLKVFNDLHNQYYDRVGLSDDIDKNPACKALLAKAQASDTAPMVEWLTLPDKEIESCPAFKGAGDASLRTPWKERFLRGYDPSSPFTLIRKDKDGGTGTRPDERVLPVLKVQPERVVVPPKQTPNTSEYSQ